MRSAYAVVGVGFLILIGGISYISYYDLWSIGARIIPLIELSQRVEVAEPSAFSVPEEFQVSIFADNVPGARVLTRDTRGVLVVSLMSEGKVVALPDEDGNGKADRVVTILEGLNTPHGILFYEDFLYVAETNQVMRYAYDAETFTASVPERVLALPDTGGHATRSLFLHPDGETLLVAVGSSCNVCNEDDERRATILAVDLKSSEWRVWARGLRNTVFMAMNPINGDLWGTDMGRDLLGDNTPPDEINILREGGNYGWPICYGKNIHDTQFDKNTYIRAPCQEPFETQTVIDIPAHSAPLGLAFIPEEGWPEEYWGDVLIAYHGSWNRSVPTGYKVVRFDTGGGKVQGKQDDFMTGFLTPEGDVVGRPVAVLAEPGGVIYISDDKAGAVYKVSLTSVAR